MIENELLIIKTFIPALLEKQNELSDNRINIAQPLLSNVFQGLTAIEDKRQNYIKENAPNFNIFSIMRYGHYETRLHTPFLVQLLSPNGKHQLGIKFFQLFIEHIFNKTFDLPEIKNIQVFEEHTEGGILEGQIDIYIQFLYKRELHYIVVENKINADDQPLQLQRYYIFLMKKMGKSENIRLIYLTKQGSPPSIPHSINQDTYDELKSEGILQLLSYKKDIVNWIKILMNRKTPISVNEILRQYLNTIK